MRSYKPNVDSIVNMKFVDADGRHINHRLMTKEEAFRQRFDAASRHTGARNRAEFGRRLGVAEGGQKLYNWYTRDCKIPDAMRKPLAAAGLSIDWINDGEGQMLLASGPVASQSVGLDASKLAGLIETVDTATAGTQLARDYKTKARIVVAIYMDEQAMAAGPAAVTALLSSILASMELHDESTVT